MYRVMSSSGKRWNFVGDRHMVKKKGSEDQGQREGLLTSIGLDSIASQSVLVGQPRISTSKCESSDSRTRNTASNNVDTRSLKGRVDVRPHLTLNSARRSNGDEERLTLPRPTSAVLLSEESVTCFNRTSDMKTPVVLENPGLEACPPDFTANGVLVVPTIFITAETSLGLATSTTQVGVCEEEVM